MALSLLQKECLGGCHNSHALIRLGVFRLRPVVADLKYQQRRPPLLEALNHLQSTQFVLFESSVRCQPWPCGEGKSGVAANGRGARSVPDS